MPKQPTVYDVARRAGVSTATVSRTLSRPDEVRAATRDAVLAAVDELGYVPSAAARGLASRRAGTLGLLFPDADGVGITDTGELPVLTTSGRTEVEIVRDRRTAPTTSMVDLFTAEVVRGAELEAWRAGLAVTIAVARGSSATAMAADMAGRVDGMAVLSATLPNDDLQRIARRIPVVVMAAHDREDGLDHVHVDNRSAMHALVGHLVDEHGYRDLAFFGGPVGSPDGEERFAAFQEVLRDRGVPVPEAPIARSGFTYETAREATTALLQRGTAALPRVLVCANDQTALGALDVLRDAGVEVPERVALTGFDGIDASARARPRLTTVEQPMRDVGRAAIDRLLARLADPALPAATVGLPVRVLLRESCGCTG